MAAVEKKVTAGSLSAGAAGVALWALQTYVFKGSAVPAGVVSLVYLVVPAFIALAAGYLAPHTPRPGGAAKPLMVQVSNPLTEADMERFKQALATAVQPPPRTAETSNVTVQKPQGSL